MVTHTNAFESIRNRQRAAHIVDLHAVSTRLESYAWRSRPTILDFELLRTPPTGVRDSSKHGRSSEYLWP
eukprot:15432034-Alexandrium_andersonii.AAC.1